MQKELLARISSMAGWEGKWGRGAVGKNARCSFSRHGRVSILEKLIFPFYFFLE
jgi:hypothetical protein